MAVLAVISGLSALVLVQVMRQPSVVAVIARTSIVYAAADIKAGDTITPAMLESRKVPKEGIPDDAILDSSKALNLVALRPIDKGDLLTTRKLTEKKAEIVERVPVVFATADVQPGDTLQAEMLTIRDVPREGIPDDVIHRLEDVVGQKALQPIHRQDALRAVKLSRELRGTGMATRIRAGWRAVTILTTSHSSSVAGHVLPDDSVDVLLTVTPKDSSAGATTGGKTTAVVRNVKVLAVHTTVEAPPENQIEPEKALSVTLEVTPTDAAILNLAQSQGVLNLALRNQADLAVFNQAPVDLDDLHLSKQIIKDESRIFPTRTLRGTKIGSDRLMVTVPGRPRRDEKD